MKSILLSIQPQWVEKILHGEKIIEVRKTKPNCDLPIEVYIYCSKGKTLYRSAYDNKILYVEHDKKGSNRPKLLIKNGHSVFNGKVIAKFTLNKIDCFDSAKYEHYSIAGVNCVGISDTQSIELMEKKGCLKNKDIISYFGDEDYVAYFWYISDLQIFDKPKELSQFSSINWITTPKLLNRPPQSWQYIETI